MRQRAKIENGCVVARRLFDALCSKYPDKYIALVLPRDGPDSLLPAPNLVAVKAAARIDRSRRPSGHRDAADCRLVN